MGACKSCGEKAGMGKSMCSACTARDEAERKRLAEEQAAARRQREAEAIAKAAQELEDRTIAYIDATLAQMRRAHDQGLTPSLFTVEALSTTYALNGQMNGSPPDVSRLAVYAANGWEVVSTVPQTEGTGLTNRMGNGNNVWGAGVGGLVTGVYVLLRLPVTEGYLAAHESSVREAIRAQYVDGMSAQLMGAHFAAPTLESGRNGMSTLANVGLGVAGGLLVADAVGDMMGGGDIGEMDAGGGDMDFGGFDF